MISDDWLYLNAKFSMYTNSQET